jgi:hypothetical protein
MNRMNLLNNHAVGMCAFVLADPVPRLSAHRVERLSADFAGIPLVQFRAALYMYECLATKQVKVHGKFTFIKRYKIAYKVRRSRLAHLGKHPYLRTTTIFKPRPAMRMFTVTPDAALGFTGPPDPAEVVAVERGSDASDSD